jgi:type IV pilus assembly protein PilB
MVRKKIGEMLIEAGLLTERQLRTALSEQRRWGGTLGRALIDERFVTEADLLSVLSRQFNLPIIDLDQLAIAQGVLDLVPAEIARELTVVPFAQAGKSLDVAMVDPTNVGVIDELRIRTHLTIRPHLAGPKNLERALTKYYGRDFGAPRSRTPTSDPAVGVDPNKTDSSISEKARPAQQRPIEDVRSADLRNSEIDALQARLSQLEEMVAHEKEVTRKLLSLLVTKSLATREEILATIH